jgi:hypothetical protein
MGRGQDGVSTLRGDCLRFSLDMSSGLQRVAPHRGVYEETPHMQLPNPPPIYLDYHATTPVDPRVAAVIVHTMTTAFGNATAWSMSMARWRLRW